jgi:hypothetical protein
MSDCKEDNEKIIDFMSDNPNLHFRSPYGFTDSCVVDLDSEMRNSSRATHDRTKIQLCSRWHVAAPNLHKGGLVPNIESKLKNPEDTSVIKVCDRVTEKYFDRNIPLIGCQGSTIQNPDHIIMPITRGGEITRNYIFNDPNALKCGLRAPARSFIHT